jgi:hypothetical protein
VISDSTANEIVIVHGHGGGEPWSVGEQDLTRPSSHGQTLQREGNKVEVEEILEKYDNRKKYAAVLLVACNEGEKTIEARGVPVFYVKGLTGARPVLNQETRPAFSLPKNS